MSPSAPHTDSHSLLEVGTNSNHKKSVLYSWSLLTITLVEKDTTLQNK
ncbi:hypothetical protein EDC56_0312 [Sinobacterium caligoides]|uniref:Uncharacterized protein n=1 Tax=Sinobacterium caligoides TaxID=933926 RepID=A0A3N2DZD5_9GAMM|nr:hypothetical protein EDC56_0312 [Sinobacterium caligoides]